VQTELPDINTIVVPDKFDGLSKFVESHGIKVEKVTKPSYKALLKAVKKWGVANGYRIIQSIEVPTLSQAVVDEDAETIEAC
jgi:hypothetical protein